jgi:hypothetical protein
MYRPYLGFTDGLFVYRMIFGYLSEQYFPVFSTFVVGEVLCIIYTAVFYYYSHEKPKAHKVILLYGIPYVALSTYALLGGLGVTHQTRHEVGNIVGYFSIVTGIIVFSSPLEKVGPVLKHRSAVFFNIQMIYAGTVNNLMWVIYSSLTQHWIIFAPNAFSLVSGCFQITLYWIFHPSTHPMPVLPTAASAAMMVEPAGGDAATTSKLEETDEDEPSADDVAYECVVAIDDTEKEDGDSVRFVALASPHASQPSV